MQPDIFLVTVQMTTAGRNFGGKPITSHRTDPTASPKSCLTSLALGRPATNQRIYQLIHTYQHSTPRSSMKTALLLAQRSRCALRRCYPFSASTTRQRIGLVLKTPSEVRTSWEGSVRGPSKMSERGTGKDQWEGRFGSGSSTVRVLIITQLYNANKHS